MTTSTKPLHRAADIAADHHAAGQAQQNHQRPRAPQGPDDLADIGLGGIDIGPDEQDLAVLQPLLHAPRGGLDLGAVQVGLGDLEAGPLRTVAR